jgi:metacaspase-1
MSYAFITALKANPEQSYVELLNSIRDILEKDYSQKPQLSCSHPLGMSTLYLFLSRVKLTPDRHRPALCHVSAVRHTLNLDDADRV